MRKNLYRRSESTSLRGSSDARSSSSGWSVELWSEGRKIKENFNSIFCASSPSTAWLVFVYIYILVVSVFLSLVLVLAFYPCSHTLHPIILRASQGLSRHQAKYTYIFGGWFSSLSSTSLYRRVHFIERGLHVLYIRTTTTPSTLFALFAIRKYIAQYTKQYLRRANCVWAFPFTAIH